MKNLNIIALAILIFIQLTVAGKIIYDKQQILAKGKVYKFKSEPVDPNDPFRGKYITLNYEADSYTFKNYDLQETDNFIIHENIWVTLYEDNQGFAQISTITKQEPKGENNYVKAKVSQINTNEDKTQILVKYSFERLYVEESKAKPVEDIYRKFVRNDSINIYSKVHIKNGNAVLEDVYIGEMPISEAVEKQAE